MGSAVEAVEELTKLPSEEKLRIIDRLWQSIPTEDLPVDEAVLDEMDRRFEDYLEDQSRAENWESVERSVRSKLTARK